MQLLAGIEVIDEASFAEEFDCDFERDETSDSFKSAAHCSCNTAPSSAPRIVVATADGLVRAPKSKGWAKLRLVMAVSRLWRGVGADGKMRSPWFDIEMF